MWQGQEGLFEREDAMDKTRYLFKKMRKITSFGKHHILEGLGIWFYKTLTQSPRPIVNVVTM